MKKYLMDRMSFFGVGLPVIGSGEWIPYGLSLLDGKDGKEFCLRLPLWLTWKQHSFCHYREVWGTLNVFLCKSRGLKLHWVEHSYQPEIL